MKGIRDIIESLRNADSRDLRELLERLPGKNCGQCGFPTCEEFAELLLKNPEALKRCIFIEEGKVIPEAPELREEDITWRDILDRPYDFILDRIPGDPGPRETILPFNPANVEKLGVKKGDILFGRPTSTGCPVTHCGVVMEEPDYFNGTIVWCIVGPIPARERGINIGDYTPTAYEGIVQHTKEELQVGRRYFFLPRYCMLQSRHSGLVNIIAKRDDGIRVRAEGIWIG